MVAARQSLACCQRFGRGLSFCKRYRREVFGLCFLGGQRRICCATFAASAAATATTVAAFILASVATCFSAVVARGHVAIGGTGILRLIHTARLALVATPAATSTATILLTIGFIFGWCRRGDST